MAIEKSKILKTAEKYVASGKVAQAIDEYLKILKENPKDWPLMIQVGDLLLKVNRSDEAIENFQKVADHYYSDGFFLKAIAIYKRINKLNPNLTDICCRLADLYLKQGLTMDAKSQLHIVAQHYLSKNQNKDAIETLQRLIEIEPDNLKNRNELAKAYKNEGMIPEAIQEYLRITEELTSKNLFKECVAVLETAHKLDGANIEVLQKLLSLYSEDGQPEKGISLLEETLKNHPTDADILALLAEAYSGRNEHEKAHELMERAIFNASNKEPLWELKGNLYIQSRELDRAFEQFNLVVEKEIQRKDIDRAVFIMQRITEADSTYHRAWEKLTELYTLLRQHANLIAAQGSLADAYMSKLMYAEAAEALEKLVKLDPEDSQHQEKLKFVNSHLPETKPDTKVPEKVYEVEADVARPVQQQHHFGPVGLTSETLPGFPVFHAQPAPQAPAPVQTVQQPVAAKNVVSAITSHRVVSAEENAFVSEHLIEAEVFNKYGLIDKAIEQLNSIISKYPFSVPAHQKLKEIFLEKGERDRAVEQCIQMSGIFRTQGDLDQAEDLLSEARQINPNHSGLNRAFKELASTSTNVAEPAAQQAPAAVTPPASAPEPESPVARTVQPATKQPVKTKKSPQVTVEIPGLKSLETKVSPKPKTAATAQTGKTADATAAKARAALTELEKLAQQIKTQSSAFKIKTAAPPAQKSVPPLPPTQSAPPGEVFEIEVEIEEPQAPPPAILPESEFEEIDFFIDQGLITDAKNALIDLEKRHPADPAVIRRLERIGAMEAEPQPQKQEAVPPRDEPVPDVPAAGLSVQADSSDEIVISLDEEFESLPAPDQEQPVVPPVAESAPLPELQEVALSQEAPSASVTDQKEPVPADQTVEAEAPPVQAQGVAEEPFTEFGELEDSSETALNASPLGEDGSFEESFSAAVDAVFKVSDQPSAESVEQSSDVKIVKEELFEEEEDFFDLAAELEEGLLSVQSAVEEDRPTDGQNYSIEEILTDFRKGVDKQLSSEDYDTRYNLGIAYKEMGLIDEAIAEFQIAAKDPKRFLECCSMLGLCFMEKGMPKLAIKWYQKGLESPGYSEEEYQGLRFDLAQAHESLGETDRALEVFQEVYGISANYRNVAKKVKELQERKVR